MVIEQAQDPQADVAAQAVALETPPETDTPPAQQPETDYKALWEQDRARIADLEKARTSAENFAKQQEGRIRKAERDAQAWAEEKERLRRMELRQEAYEKGIDPDSHVAQGIGVHRRQSFKTGAEAEANRVFAEAERMNLDPSTDDAFEEARDYLAEAADAPNEATYKRALNASRRAADRALAELRAKQAPAKAPEPAPKQADPDLKERTRAFERGRGLPEQSGGGSGFSRFEDLRDAYITGRVSPEDYIRLAHTRFGQSV